MLARLVGAVFLVPFLWFLWRGWIAPHLQVRLWTIFGFGAALGAVGWWMVASGLAGRVDGVAVSAGLPSDARLRDLRGHRVDRARARAARARRGAAARSGRRAMVLLALVIVQIYLGALVSGLRAGLIYNTWPLIDGSLMPDSARLFFHAPAWRNCSRIR